MIAPPAIADLKESGKRCYRDALCAMYTGQILEARRALERALAIDPNHADVHQLLWEIRHRRAA